MYNLLKLKSRPLFPLFCRLFTIFFIDSEVYLTVFHANFRGAFQLSTRKALLYGLSIICICISELYFLRKYKSSVKFVFRSHHLHFSFLSRAKVNWTNWPAPNVWVFTAEMVEHCSANAEALSSNPVEVQKIFFSGLSAKILSPEKLFFKYEFCLFQFI